MNNKFKFLVLATLVSLTSCKKEEVQPKMQEVEPVEVLDCDCDEVTKVTTYNLPTLRLPLL